VYTANFGGKPPAGNIIDIPTEDIPEFDLLTAGFPCQVLIAEDMRAEDMRAEAMQQRAL